MKRIEKLRTKALENNMCFDDFFYRFYKTFLNSSEETLEKRYSQAFDYAFSNMAPTISEDELIVGKYEYHLTGDEAEEWNNEYKEKAAKYRDVAGDGMDSHMTIDYELLLGEGICGIIKKIDGYLTACDEEKKAYYEMCKVCLNAVVKYAHNYSKAAEKMAQECKDAQRKEELIKIAEICKNVPENPAQTFYEAVQSVSFITHCISMDPFKYCYQQFQLGHPDRYLYPYYKKDIENGSITPEFAQLLLDCLAIHINTRAPQGGSSGYMVGGRDENGNIVANELTIMCMQVIEDIRLVYPSVGLCYTKGMDDKYLDKAIEILSHGRSHPAIFNDDVITEGLKRYGVPEKEAHSYIHSTCVEITPVASSNVWVASPYTNMAQLLLDCMDREYDNLDELIKTIFETLDEKIKRNFEEQLEKQKYRSQNSVTPLLSCFVNDCLADGTDIDRGGAKYNWIMPSFVGMANLVDSLYAIKEIVFDKKELTVKEFKNMLDDNFENNEGWRLRILNNIPKYGNDNDEVDKYFEIIINHIVDECKKYEGFFRQSKLIPSVFCWIMHELFGRDTGATPDGRKAGFPLGDGSGPCQGREMNGPTASIMSSTKWEHTPLIGGVAVNMKFSKKSLGATSNDVLKSLVKTYMNRGGFELQINIVDRETLINAIEEPEKFRDLVVRIGGYSDYFIKLSPQMQQEILLRTEHELN